MGRQRDWIVKTGISGVQVALKVDTGSQANLLPLSVYKKMQPKPPLKHSRSILRSYSGCEIKHVGVISVEVTIGDQCSVQDFFIVKKGRQALLGLQGSERLGLLARNVDLVATNSSEELVQEFNDIFKGTGCVQRQYKMKLRDDAIPVVQAARRVPLALKEPLRTELGRMEQAGIIVKENEPTDWVSPLVIVKKKDWSLGVCMDPRRLNACLKREHYEMPSRDHIEAELSYPAQRYSLALTLRPGFTKSLSTMKLQRFAALPPLLADTGS